MTVFSEASWSEEDQEEEATVAAKEASMDAAIEAVLSEPNGI